MQKEVLSSRTRKVREHYDIVSSYYERLWSRHIHHGYYLTGKESKEKATENLIELIVNKMGIYEGANVLDIGCGVGGTSIWLAKHFGCRADGITISPVQVQMAKAAAKVARQTDKTNFFVADANNLHLKGKYDFILAIEMVSHLNKKRSLFKHCAKLLNKGGKLCIIDWFHDRYLTQSQKRKYILPIEEGMIVSLQTSKDYIDDLEKHKLKLRYQEDLSEQVKKTWNICLEIIENQSFWDLAAHHGLEFIEFLRAFEAMRAGYASKTFKYEIMVFEK